MKKMTQRICLLLSIAFVAIFPSVTHAQSNTNINEEIIYSILVDRFNNGDQKIDTQVNLADPIGYHGGDLKGIIMKLDDLKELGFTTLSLSPIMKNAPNGYHGYWIEDYYDVEEQFGTLADAKELVKEAHKRDLKVIMEFPTNYIAKTNPIATDVDKTAWLKPEEATTEEWQKNAVQLNQDNPEVTKYLLDAAQFWIDETNIDGFKLDKIDQIPQGFLNTFTETIKVQNIDFYLIGSLLEADDGITFGNFDAIDNKRLYKTMTEKLSKVGEPLSDLAESAGGLIYVDNKDTARFAQQAGEYNRIGLTAWKLALTYLYTAPGTPIIYQGSELPMYGKGFPENQVLVQFNSGDADLKDVYKRLGALRAQFPVLANGAFSEVGKKGAMSVFKRTDGKETMYIAINNDDKARNIYLKDLPKNIQLRGLLGDNIVRADDAGAYKVGIDRETAEVYVIEENSGFNWAFIGMVGGIFIIFISSIIYLSIKQRIRMKKESV